MGLGLPRIPVGTPGINPGAPDPRPTLGLPTGPLQAPQGPAQAGLGLGAVFQEPAALPNPNSAGTKLNDIAAGILGGERRSDQIARMRAQRFEQQQRALLLNLSLLEKFGEQIQNTPVSRQGDVSKQLRTVYEKLAPGGGEFFDATAGNVALAPEFLKNVAENDAVKLIIAQGGTGKDVTEFLKSPAFLEQQLKQQDQALIGKGDQMVRALLSSTDPEVQKLLAEVRKDGRINLGELRRLNELGTQGPEGTQIPEAVLQAIERNPEEFAQRFPDLYETPGDIEAKKGLDVQRELLKLKAEFTPEGRGEAITPNKQVDLLTRAQKEDAVARRSLISVDRALKQSQDPNGAGDIGILYRFINQLDNTAAREGELALAQRAQSISDRLKSKFGNIKEGTVLGPELRAQLREELTVARQQLQRERELVLGNYRRVASELGARESVVSGIDSLVEFGETSTADAKGSDVGARKLSGASKPKQVIQNGVTYTLNEATGEYE